MSKVKLGDIVCRIKDLVDKDNTDLIYYIGGEHFDNRSLTVTRKGIIKGSTIGPAFSTKFKAGDVLLMSRNPHLRKAGIVNFDGICSDVSYIIRTRDENVIMQKFIPILFQSDAFWTFAEKNKKGSTNFFLNWSDFERFEFDLPDIETQQKLCNELWAINDTIDSYKEMIRQSDELIKAKFIEMFGDPNSIIIKDTVTDAFEIRDDLRKPLNDGERKSMKDGMLYPYYGANGQVDNINKYLMDCEALCIAEDCGSYGYGQDSSYIVRGKSWVNNHAHVLICKENCDIEYANVFFRLLDMTKIVNGTTRQKLTQGSLKNVPMFIPPISEQKIFRDCLTIIEANKEKLLKCIKSASLLYSMIITKYLTKEEN